MLNDSASTIPPYKSNVHGITLNVEKSEKLFASSTDGREIFEEGFYALRATNTITGSINQFIVAQQEDYTTRIFKKFGDITIVPYYPDETIEKFEVSEQGPRGRCALGLIIYIRKDGVDELLYSKIEF